MLPLGCIVNQQCWIITGGRSLVIDGGMATFKIVGMYIFANRFPCLADIGILGQICFLLSLIHICVCRHSRYNGQSCGGHTCRRSGVPGGGRRLRAPVAELCVCLVGAELFLVRFEIVPGDIGLVMPGNEYPPFFLVRETDGMVFEMAVSIYGFIVPVTAIHLSLIHIFSKYYIMI